MDIKAIKELYERRQEEKVGGPVIFYILPLFLDSTTILLWCWQKKDTGNTKGLIEKHIYSSNRNKMQVNLVKQ